MALQYFAGQRLTADQLQLAVPERVVQGSDQTVSSSTTLVDTNITFTVDELMKVNLEVRYTTDGGGIRWAWATTGSITQLQRGILSAGSSTSGDTTNTADMRNRSIVTLTEEQTVDDFTTFTSNRIFEELVIEGSGTLTLQFAQDTSNAGDTTFDGQSYVIITRLGS